MKRLQLPTLSLLLIMLLTFSSCEAIGGIFKAGMWTAVIIIVAIVAIIMYFVNRSRK